MATLTVGSGKQFATIAAATAAAKDGDTVAVSAGTYVNDYATVRSRISLVAVGGKVTMASTASVAPAKALLTVTADASIDNFVFTGMRTADGTGAGVLVQGGAVTVSNSLFTGNQNGLLATANAATTVTIVTSEFTANGNNDGFTANILAGAIKALTVRDSLVRDAAGATELRSRAATTVVTGTRITDDTAAAAYAIDLPTGGAVTLTGNTIQKSASSSSAVAIHYGGETLQAGSSLGVIGNTLVSDRSGAVLLQNQASVTAAVSSNVSYGFATIATGPAALAANSVAASRPTTAAGGTVVSVPVATATASVAPPVEYGRAGAVVASGRVLTVGPGQGYATLAAALAASADGDTIRVQAGTYLDDGGIVARKVIIEGVNGIARFVATTTPANGAVFVTQADATFRNVEIFGASVPGGVAAAIDAKAGALTIVNSTIHDNQAGLVAEGGVVAVGVYDTEIARNGTADGKGGNVAVAGIDTLALRNDYVHDAVAGPEIASLAHTTVLDSDRVSQATGNAAPVVSLPNAGQVSIGNSAIQSAADRGASSTAAPVVQVGGGTPYAGSAVSLKNDTLISGKGTSPLVVNASGSVSLAVTDTVFVGGGTVPVVGGSNVGASVGTGLTVGTAAPNGATAAPDPAPLTSSVVPAGAAAKGQLVLYVSETAWRGDAQYTLMVDGVAVGGTLTATASHAAGQSQRVVIAGSFAPGPHVVSAAFTNSLGTGDAGRSLSIDAMQFNGEDTHQSATLTANGTALLATTPTTRSVPVTVSLSEDAWKGDALAFVSIDGRVLGGVQTVTAAHGAGATMGLSFLTDLAPGPHTASVTFLNGAAGSGRALYVDAIDVAGQVYAAAAAKLDAGGSSNFAFTVAPPPSANGALYVTVGAPTDLAVLLPG